MEEKFSKKLWKKLTMEQADQVVGGNYLDDATPEEKQHLDELWQEVLRTEHEGGRLEHQWAYEAWATYVDRLYEKYGD